MFGFSLYEHVDKFAAHVLKINLMIVKSELFSVEQVQHQHS